MKDLFKKATTWFIIFVACVSATILTKDGTTLDKMFDFWAFASFFVWIWRCNVND